MNILLLSRGYTPKEEPLWGCFEIQQAEALKNAGHNVVVACVDDRLIAKDRFLRCLELPGIKKLRVKGIPVFSSFILPRRVAMLLGFRFYNMLYNWQFNRLYKIIEKEHGRPDVIYSHYMRVNFFAASLHEKYHVPAVGVEHWSELYKPVVDKQVIALGEKTYSRLDKVIAVSLPLSANIERMFGVKPEIVSNIVDIDYVKTTRKISKNKIIKITTISRLFPTKRIDILLRALAKVCFADFKWELTVVGAGPLEKELKALNKELGLTDKVHFVGQKSHEEICQILAESDFFALASQYETFGVVFVEAMSFGLPVIGTRCGGPEMIINENNGLLVPNDDVEAMADALKYMMENYANYSAEAIMREAKDKYSPEAIVPEIEKVLKAAIDKYKK